MSSDKDEEIESIEDLIPKERLAKGDLTVSYNMRGKINRAIPASLTIIKELVRRGIIPYHHEIYAVGFSELRAAFRAPWAVRSSAVLLEQWGIGLSASKADSIYQHVCRKIGIWRGGVIEFIVETDKSHENKNHHALYNDCLSRLVEAMDEEREKAKEEAGLH
jgi:hypothetical protein